MPPVRALHSTLTARIIVAVIACCLFLASCGVPIEPQPQALDKSQVPYGLLAPSTGSTSTPPTTPEPSGLLTPMEIYLLGASGKLVARPRDVSLQTPLQGIIGQLIAGPTAGESADGLTSGIPVGTRVLAAWITDGVATVDLSSNFNQLTGGDRIEAVAEIVFTATAQLGVTSVSLQAAGKQVAMPAGTGTDATGNFTSADFQQFAP